MDGDRNISAPSPPRTQKKIVTTTGILTSSPLPSRSLPLPTLPFEIVEEILCRLPVKFLLQLRCVCKSWKSLISDTKFSRKHLRVSTTRHHLILSSVTFPPYEVTFMDCPISPVLTTVTTAAAMQLQYPPNNNNCFPVGSCDGILFCNIDNNSALLWNPTIRKFNKLPDIGNGSREGRTVYGFGYDNLTNQYKVVAAFCYKCDIDSDIDLDFDWEYKSQVKVHTVGTNCWRMIDKEFSYGYFLDLLGTFVNGTINWMTFKDSIRVIVSFDLGNESYGEVLQPDYGTLDYRALHLVGLTMSVLRDCLCILSHSETFSDFWVMKEYGNKESWTKLFSISRNLGIDPLIRRVLYVSEDDRVLLELSPYVSEWLIVYDSKDGTFKTLKIQNINDLMTAKLYVESLISPFS